VILAPASVQGANAPGELLRSLHQLVGWQAAPTTSTPQGLAVDVILMVRGGGAMEDLWAFNDEALVRAVASCPIPIVSGVGHETDFTLTDFAADLRAPTPTAAAEMVASERAHMLAELGAVKEALDDALQSTVDRMSQRLDWIAGRLGRPSSRMSDQTSRLNRLSQSLHFGLKTQAQRNEQKLLRLSEALPRARQKNLQDRQQRLLNLETRLGLLDPHLVLDRGYAWLTNESGQALTKVADFQVLQAVTATLADGQVDLQVKGPR
jgi:exodeoxyribonuclease VII large subunit